MDEILREIVGPIGVWQACMVLLMTLSSSNTAIQPNFLNTVPKFRCKMEPDIEEGILSATDEASKLLNLINNQCLLPQTSSKATMQELIDTYGKDDERTVKCERGYVYEYEEYQYLGGIVAQWDLVCGQSWLVPFSESVFIAGMIFGLPLGGWLSDKYGRRPVFLASLLLEALTSIGACVSPLAGLFVAFRFLIAVGFGSRLGTTIVLLAELTTGKYRIYVISAVTMILFGLQSIILGFFGYFITNWRLLTGVMIIPYAFGIAAFFLLTESPKWLASQDDFDGLVTALFQGYHWNQRIQSKKDGAVDKEEFVAKMITSIEETTVISVDSPESPVMWDSSMIKLVVICMVLFAGHITNLFGISLYSSSIHLHTSFVVMLNGATSSLGPLFAIGLVRIFKWRKKPLLITLAISETTLLTTCLYTLIGQPSNDIFLFIASNVVLATVFTAHAIMFVYLPELFPPGIRNMSFGLVTGLSRILALMVPLINCLDAYVMHGLPLVIYTLVVVIEFVVVCFLRNTDGESDQVPLQDPVQPSKSED